MKKIYLFIFFFGYSCAYAQIKFQRTFGNGVAVDGYGVEQTNENGYILWGSSTGGQGFIGINDGNLVKTNPAGGVLWQRKYGDIPLECFFNGVKQTTDGGYIITGSSYNHNVSGFYEILLIKTDSIGNIKWQRTYGGVGPDHGYDVIQTSDGGFLVCGSKYNIKHDCDNIAAIKVNASGDLLWYKTYPSNVNQVAKNILELGDGFMMACKNESDTSSKALIIKIDLTGIFQWAKQTNNTGSTFYWASAMLRTSDGGFIIGGSGLEGANLSAWLSKFNSTGTLTWSKIYTSPEVNNHIYTTSMSPSGKGFALCGMVNLSSSLDDQDAFLVIADSMGNLMHSRRYGGSSREQFYNMVKTADNGFALAGETWSFNGYEAYFIKTDNNGNSGCNEYSWPLNTTSGITTFTDISLMDSSIYTFGIPTLSSVSYSGNNQELCFSTGLNELTVAGNITVFPNPVRSSFIFKSNIIIDAFYIYSLTGEKCYSFRGVIREQEFDISSLSSGMYLIHIITNGSSVVKKIIKE